MNIRKSYLAVCQKIGAMVHAPTAKQTQIGLFLVGVSLLTLGLSNHSAAQNFSLSFGSNAPDASVINYNEDRILAAVRTIFGYIEGAFGALVMVVSGLGAILSSAFGQYKAALGCLVVAVGSFILRSVVATFFDISAIE